MDTSCTAYALVRHIESADDELVFRDFRFWRAANPGLVRDAQAYFPDARVQMHNEWVYERHYAHVPENFGSVPFDVLETLLLLRLFRTGENFVRAPHRSGCKWRNSATVAPEDDDRNVRSL
jgi:hypothetical protein